MKNKYEKPDKYRLKMKSEYSILLLHVEKKKKTKDRRNCLKH